jgi:hypothetical protein
MERSEEILDRAVGLSSESQEPWDCVVALHRRGDAATFHAAAEFLRSSDPTRRVLAVDVLAQLGAERNVPVEEPTFCRAGGAVASRSPSFGT